MNASTFNPAGATVTDKNQCTGMQGKLYCFEIVARDTGRESGRGTRTRSADA